MTDNVQLKDGLGDLFTARTKDVGVSGDPIQIPASTPFDQYGTPLMTPANPAIQGQIDIIVAANMTRPANTTAYASGQLIANSTVAGSVTPIALAVGRINGASCRCPRARLTKSTTSVTNAIFRAHMYKSSPVVSNGDGAAWLSNNALDYLGSFTFDMTSAAARVFTDGAKVIAVPDVGPNQYYDLRSTTQNIYALLEARGAYTPGSAELFTLALELTQN